MSGSGVEENVLLGAVTALRTEVAGSRLPLDLAETQVAKAHREALLHQLDDYVLPRLSSLDAPLLAVIGGSTGAGKSTLVNSVVDAEVSRSGVLRPTTTTPVLVHHPDDQKWFIGDRVLPGLSRVTGGGSGEDGPGSVRLVPSRSLPPGLAMLDAPDIDSVVSANRALASQLLAAADLWLFVTTAARYADAVPWALLREASDRGTAVAIVLDRVPPEAMTEIRSHLASMLREQGLATAPIFGIPETTLTAEGRLPEEAVARLKSWLAALASDARARASVVKQTLGGALDSLDSRTGELVHASRAQHDATQVLRKAFEQAYADAVASVEHGMTDGTLLRGEVLARWQEFVGTGEFFKQVESAVSARPRPDRGRLQGRAAAQRRPRRGAADRRRCARDLPGTGSGLGGCPGVALAARWPRAAGASTLPSPSPRPDCRATSTGWCATGRARSSTWCALRAATGAPRRASRHTG